ncbi:MAG TPA: glycosyltransferase [Phycisphaerae bacterium]|nr:glycosyltransferase [Phycisphaerae bacterium]HRY71248.1 glycosyltransferase [Phycisphaerae bacterium]HSA29672.1 glycosyltransferase [Phycisphaerae bacterium]
MASLAVPECVFSDRNLDADPRSAMPGRVLVVTVISTMVMAVFASTYVPYRVFTWSLSLIQDHPNRTLLLPAILFMTGAALLSGGRWIIFFSLTFLELRRYRRRRSPPVASWPTVSIFVPAFNEGDTIASALASLIALDYPSFEVIVVDDGSTDATHENATRFQGDYHNCRVRVYRKPNGGKWSALNFAFTHSTGELCLCVDADSKLAPQSIRLMVERMSDPKVDAVAGQIRVRNRVNLLTRLQALEYVMASGALRLAQSHSGTVLVVPGPLGLYRRSIMEEVFMRWGTSGRPVKPGHIHGPLDGDTFAEDFDLSLSVLSLGGRILYEPYAVSHTKAPEWSFALLSQRYRWARGTIQVLKKYIRRSRAYPPMLRPRVLGWLAITYGAEMFALPFAYAAGMAAVLFYLVSGGSLAAILLGACPVLMLSLNAAAFCIALHGDSLSLLPALLVYDLYHGFMLNSAWLIAVFDEIRGTSMRWS